MANYTTNSLLFPILLIVSIVYALSNSNHSFAKPIQIQTQNVLSFGAKPNGLTDSTAAFLRAWATACASGGAALVYVPKGRFLVGPMAFRGPCKSLRITVWIDGTLVGPLDYRVLGAADNWLAFDGVSGVTVAGGLLDARGPTLWACKTSGKANCPAGATSLRFTNSENIKVVGLVSLNSQMFHVVINYCKNVEMRGVKIIASGNSPNTDGIHVQLSTNVTILNSNIKTGDDCVSIGPGTTNLWIERITCGPGHGISIGSLAKDLKEEGVQNVTVKKAVFTSTQNGLRIKSWARPSKGFVRNVQFIDATMQNVQYPIVIDQNYCPGGNGIYCPNQVSGIKVSNILYQNIRGTSATKVAVKFDCSKNNPCTGIRLQDVNLSFQNEEANTYCVNANGEALGEVLPSGCL